MLLRMKSNPLDLPNFVLVMLAIVQIRVTVLAILFWPASIGWSIYNRWYQAGAIGQSPGNKALNLRLVSAWSANRPASRSAD
jgi:uncharacterized RDD family membrane protein YckC